MVNRSSEESFQTFKERHTVGKKNKKARKNKRDKTINKNVKAKRLVQSLDVLFMFVLLGYPQDKKEARKQKEKTWIQGTINRKGKYVLSAP